MSTPPPSSPPSPPPHLSLYALRFVWTFSFSVQIERNTFAEQGDALRDWIASARALLSQDRPVNIKDIAAVKNADAGFPPAGVGGISPFPSPPGSGSGSGFVAKPGGAGKSLWRRLGGLWRKRKGQPGPDGCDGVA